MLTFTKGMPNNTELSARHIKFCFFSHQQDDIVKFVILILNLWLEHQVLSSFLYHSYKHLEERETSTMFGFS